MSNLYQEIKQQLAKHYALSESAALAKLILTEHFDVPTIDLYTGKGIELTEKQQQELATILQKLEKQVPVQYILGYAFFKRRRFMVTPDVLIPRPETEELVNLVVRNNTVKQPKILDVGTGSGCIALSLAGDIEEANVTAIDISDAALKVAQSNALQLKVKVEFIQMNILKSLPNGCFDVVVSNPPYIAEKEKKEMEHNVLDYEPSLALFVSDDDPLLFYRVIAEKAQLLLNKEGRLYFEINQAYGEEVKQLLIDLQYSDVKLYKDLNQKDRIVTARR